MFTPNRISYFIVNGYLHFTLLIFEWLKLCLSLYFFIHVSIHLEPYERMKPVPCPMLDTHPPTEPYYQPWLLVSFIFYWEKDIP